MKKKQDKPQEEEKIVLTKEEEEIVANAIINRRKEERERQIISNEESNQIRQLERSENELNNTPERKLKEKFRKLPINNLDSAWLSAEPDYKDMQQTFIKDKYSAIFELFNSSIRLANIPAPKVKLLEYDLVTAGYALYLGLPEIALAVFYDICSVVEVSHGVKGFRTNAMNKIIQEIHQKNEETKPGVWGGNKGEKQ
jgi:hypothetical protein